MDRQSGLLLLLGGVALAAIATQANAAAWWQGDDLSPPIYPPPDQSASDSAAAAVISANDPVGAFLAVIRQFESHNDYSILYGGGHFSDFSKHPRVAVPINIPGYGSKKSTAAGAYQINAPTYDDFAPRLGISDFSPASQDRIAVAILQQCGAYDAIIAGDVQTAFALASKRWASLPYSTAGQNPQTIAKAQSLYDWFLTESTT